MTKTKRKVTVRETDAKVFEVGHYKPIIVSVHPKYIGFRLKGRGKTYNLAIERLYILAVMADIEDKRRKAKNAKRR